VSDRAVRRSGDVRRAGTAALAALAGCEGPASTLAPAGRAADQIAALFWWMTGGAAAIWLAFTVLAIYATYAGHPRIDAQKARRLVVIGGAAFPTVVLAGLLTYGLATLPGVLAAAPKGSLGIHVTGEQYWWRVRYAGPAGETIELANELRLPVGEPVQLELDSPDVIHSFWIPSLGGKMDMIPGRTTRLRLEPTRTGTFRGLCAEYCGASHAFMAFTVVVMEKEAFTRWLAAQAAPAIPPAEPLAERGRTAFEANGCGACHAVRGTAADGRIGPDLTHVGSRETLAAGRLPNDAAALERWIAEPHRLKPGARMPQFGMLPAEDRRAIAVYLERLR
jgi:cytochrome c oxidase subunit II